MNYFCNRAAVRSYSLLLSLLMIIVTVSSAHASAVRHLWQSSDQFVALEQQDRPSTGPAPLNDHPFTVTRERIISILAAIEISATEGGNREPLFTASAVQTIAPHLLQGLMQASPAEDVTFAVIGLHDTLYGLAKSPNVTTGRVFHQNGHLNIIIGIARQEVRDREDRRLFPFTPGSRNKPLKGEWQIMPLAGQKGFNQIRKDWVLFSDDWQAPALEKNIPLKQVTPTERLTTLKELKEKGLISDEEYRSKRQEIINGL